MILRVDIIDKALNSLKKGKKSTKVILLDARGKRFTQTIAKSLSKSKHLILIAGHYEGIDHRVYEHLTNKVISIGDYVLTGGEIPAMVLVDSIVRLIPGVLGADEGLNEESHSSPGYIEYPQYTRPENYKSWKVPQVLLSGNHKKIEKWRTSKTSSETRVQSPMGEIKDYKKI